MKRKNELVDIDPHVRCLVAALQKAGCQTLASCQGHAVGGHAPYVYFKCSIEKARELDNVITQSNSLHFRWEMTAHFGVSGLTWLLRSPNMESFKWSSFVGLQPTIWRRSGSQQVVEELHQIARLISKENMTPPCITKWQHFQTVTLDLIRTFFCGFRFELGICIGIMLGGMVL